MSYAVAMNIDNTDLFQKKIPRISPGIVFAVKNTWFENAVPCYKLSLLRHLKVLYRLQSMRI